MLRLLALLLFPAALQAQGVAPRVVTMTVSDSAITLRPAAVAAGPVTLRLVNRGRQVHALQLSRAPRGRSAAEAVAALRSETGQAVMPPYGGVGPVRPSAEAAVTQVLSPGAYVVWDPRSDPRGTPNRRRGLVAGLEVTGDSVRAEPALRQRLNIVTGQAGWRVQDVLWRGGRADIVERRMLQLPTPAGDLVIQVDNPGSRPTQVVVLRAELSSDMRGYADGVTPDSLLAVLGGSGMLAGGQRVWLHLRLPPGSYWLFNPMPRGDGLRGFEMAERVQVQTR